MTNTKLWSMMRSNAKSNSESVYTSFVLHCSGGNLYEKSNKENWACLRKGVSIRSLVIWYRANDQLQIFRLYHFLRLSNEWVVREDASILEFTFFTVSIALLFMVSFESFHNSDVVTWYHENANRHALFHKLGFPFCQWNLTYRKILTSTFSPLEFYFHYLISRILLINKIYGFFVFSCKECAVLVVVKALCLSK